MNKWLLFFYALLLVNNFVAASIKSESPDVHPGVQEFRQLKTSIKGLENTVSSQREDAWWQEALSIQKKMNDFEKSYSQEFCSRDHEIFNKWFDRLSNCTAQGNNLRALLASRGMFEQL